MQRIRHEAFIVAGAVGMRGVDEVDADLDGPAQHLLATFGIDIGAPVAGLPGEAHGAVADARNLEIAADLSGSFEPRCCHGGCPSGGCLV